MRILYYTHPAMWEPALSMVRALSRHVTVHLVVEVGPDAWRSSAFDVSRPALPPGLHAAEPIIADAVPDAVRAYWRDTASFQLLVHGSRRSLHPASRRRSSELLRFAHEIGVDVLHVEDVDVSPRLSLGLPFHHGPPIVLNVHDPEPHSGESGWRKTLSRRLTYPHVSRFLLHNTRQREQFCHRYRLAPGAVDVVTLGSYEILRAWQHVEAQPDVGPQPPTVLFFGRLSPYKGLDVLYDALPDIARAIPDVRIIVAGKAAGDYVPPPPPVLPPPARIERIDDYIDNPTSARLFQSADLVVCPYTDATQSGVVLTAYGFDRPVVATRVGGLPEYVDDGCTGLLVSRGDASALAAAIVRLLRDPALRSRMADDIVAAKQRWLDWQPAAARLIDIYSSVIARHRQ